MAPRACRALVGIGFMLAASPRTAAAQCFFCGYDELGGYCRTALTGSASCNTIADALAVASTRGSSERL